MFSEEIVQEEVLSAIPRRAVGWIKRWGHSISQEFLARRHGSYNQSTSVLRLQPCLHDNLPISISQADCIPAALAEHYLSHRFDLLGSGWVRVHYGMRCRGMGGHRYNMAETLSPDTNGDWLYRRINPSNLRHAKSVWRRIDTSYRPIDWQIDFKSGFRWSENVWSKKLPYAHLAGVDVKVPWELARMQHLPQMALRAMALGLDTTEGYRLAREMRNQLLDFIATNPPGFGVNWLCPMDVAIRAANWLLAWDLFRAGGHTIDDEDHAILASSVYDHGRFIINNLEWSSQRGNHYLSDICGLVFISSYLPESDETTGWLAFAIGQFIAETMRQFYPDGGHFEGSVAYHRLAAEMVLYTTALLLGLPESRLRKVADIDLPKLEYLPTRICGDLVAAWRLHPMGQDRQGLPVTVPFDLAFVERLRSLVNFFACIMKHNGTFPQIGDNDGGRFFKLMPSYLEMTVGTAKQKYLNLQGYKELSDADLYFFEDSLRGDHLLNAAYALGWRQSASARNQPNAWHDTDVEKCVVTALSSDRKIPLLSNNSSLMMPFSESMVGTEEEFQQLWDDPKNNSVPFKFSFKLRRIDLVVSHPTTLCSFVNFGCYIFKHPSFYLFVRCLSKTAHKSGGHYHVDQLSVELEIADEPLIRDPGTYVYTALPEERNRYRLAHAHFIPQGRSPVQANLSVGLFDILTIPPAFVRYFGHRGFAGYSNQPDVMVGLLIRIDEHEIRIMHISTPGSSSSPIFDVPPPYSPSYGIQESTRV